MELKAAAVEERETASLYGARRIVSSAWSCLRSNAKLPKPIKPATKIAAAEQLESVLDKSHAGGPSPRKKCRLG